MTRTAKIASTAAVSRRSSSSLVPVLIAATGRTDLYYTLTSVALLSIASAGVWLTFYIGRINIGQGAYALMGGYVSAILVVTYGVSFWLTLPLAGLFCAAASVLIGLPILRLRGVYFAMVTLVLTEVARLLALALPITNGAKGMVSIPLPGAICRSSASRSFRISRRCRTRGSPSTSLAVTLMVLCFAGHVPPGPFAHRPALPVAAAERGARLLDRRQHRLSARHRLCDLVLPRRRRRARCSSPSRSRSIRRASPSPTRSTSC